MCTPHGLCVNQIENAIEWGGDLPCGGHMELNGAMFVNGENPPTTGCGDCYAKLEEKIRRVVRTAARVNAFAATATSMVLNKAQATTSPTLDRGPIKTSYYIDTAISTGAADRDTYADARVLDSHGRQVLYRPCSPALNRTYGNRTAAIQGEMPLFFGNTTNSYGHMIRRYIDKIFALGIDGVYHDEYDYTRVTYTYGTWDNRSAFLHPGDLSIRALPGSLTLLTLGNELKIREIVRANNGFFAANGPPVTRTIMEGMYGVHFQEDSEHCRVKHVQTYTPVMLNRDGTSQAGDLDPRYNRQGNISGSDVCWNILNHLDDGVLSYNYQGMFPKQPGVPTINERMWPITVKELGAGFVIGRERAVTKVSGSFRNANSLGNYSVFVYQDCFLIETILAPMLVKQDMPGRGGSSGPNVVHDAPLGGVTVVLEPGQQAVIVWGVSGSSDDFE